MIIREQLEQAPGRDIDVRVSVSPTCAGEKVVMRMLRKTAIELDFAKLGFKGEPLKLLRDAYSLAMEQGMRTLRQSAIEEVVRVTIPA